MHTIFNEFIKNLHNIYVHRFAKFNIRNSVNWWAYSLFWILTNQGINVIMYNVLLKIQGAKFLGWGDFYNFFFICD